MYTDDDQINETPLRWYRDKDKQRRVYSRCCEPLFTYIVVSAINRIIAQRWLFRLIATQPMREALSLMIRHMAHDRAPAGVSSRIWPKCQGRF